MQVFPRFVTCLFVLSSLAVSARAEDATTYQKKDNKAGLTSDGGQWGFRKGGESNLPRVLLIGDSILIGYASTAKSELRGQTEVDCFMSGINIGLPKLLYDQVRAALQNGPYAVIHFNDMGLHGWQPNRIAPDQYEPLLRAYVDLIRSNAQGATLIWADTTPITAKGSPGQLDPNDAIIVERNVVAAKVMKEEGIAVDDLYGLMASHLDLARGDQFHWTPAGQALQGKQVAALVEEALKNRPPQSAAK